MCQKQDFWQFCWKCEYFPITLAKVYFKFNACWSNMSTQYICCQKFRWCFFIKHREGRRCLVLKLPVTIFCCPDWKGTVWNMVKGWFIWASCRLQSLKSLHSHIFTHNHNPAKEAKVGVYHLLDQNHRCETPLDTQYCTQHCLQCDVNLNAPWRPGFKSLLSRETHCMTVTACHLNYLIGLVEFIQFLFVFITQRMKQIGRMPM